jgi:hypothetical protein
MKIYSILIIILSLVSSLGCSKSDPQLELEKAVKNLPRNSIGSPAYWYEMNGLTGWEKVILVFGYAENSEVCQYMVKIGKKDSPERDFKCTPAN